MATSGPTVFPPMIFEHAAASKNAVTLAQPSPKQEAFVPSQHANLPAKTVAHANANAPVAPSDTTSKTTDDGKATRSYLKIVDQRDLYFQKVVVGH